MSKQASNQEAMSQFLSAAKGIWACLTVFHNSGQALAKVPSIKSSFKQSNAAL